MGKSCGAKNLFWLGDLACISHRPSQPLVDPGHAQSWTVRGLQNLLFGAAFTRVHTMNGAVGPS